MTPKKAARLVREACAKEEALDALLLLAQTIRKCTEDAQSSRKSGDKAYVKAITICDWLENKEDRGSNFGDNY